MTFTKSIQKFLESRPNKHERFYFGDWLQSLDVTTLELLRLHASAMYGQTGEHAFQASANDMAEVISTALAAETNGRRKVKSLKSMLFKMEKIRNYVEIVLMVKQGFLILHSPLSLYATTAIESEVTEKGLHEAVNLGLIPADHSFIPTN